MKVYVLRERWGRYVLSPRPPTEEAIPKEADMRLGDPIHLIDWGDWVLRPYPERVIIWNLLAKIALDTMGLTGKAAIAWIQGVVTKTIAWELVWSNWVWAGGIGVYAAAMFVLAYSAPAQRKFTWEAVYPWRYLFRYESRVWAADLFMIGVEGKLYYTVCSLVGDIIVGENRRESTSMGPLDHWDTGHLWVQRKDRLLHHEGWFWSEVWVDFIGVLTHVAENIYVLQEGFSDPYASELPVPYKVPVALLCKEWDPDYQMP